MSATPTRTFCTYFDKNYLSRGLALYHSLRAHHPSFRLFVLCLDEATKSYLTRKALPGVVPFSYSELEAHDPELLATRPTRTRVEYYFTSTPSWILFVLQQPGVDLVTYVDADFLFFSSPEPLFAEMGAAPIAVVEHRFPPALRHQEDRGRFNVGWLSFRRNEEGLACLSWWRERCIEWCYDRIEGDKFADQKYLDQWPRLFPNLVVLQHKGVNVAPWNVDADRFNLRGSQRNVDEQPLICFHFHGFKQVIGPIYQSGLQGYPVRLSKALRQGVFEPYLTELTRHEAELAREGVTDGAAKSLRYVTGGWRELSRRALDLASALRTGTWLWASRPAR